MGESMALGHANVGLGADRRDREGNVGPWIATGSVIVLSLSSPVRRLCKTEIFMHLFHPLR